MNKEVYNLVAAKTFERDGQHCFMCGSEEELELHRITPFSYNRTIAHKLYNCITLCSFCHNNVVHEALGTQAQFYDEFKDWVNNDTNKEFNLQHQQEIDELNESFKLKSPKQEKKAKQIRTSW